MEEKKSTVMEDHNIKISDVVTKLLTSEDGTNVIREAIREKVVESRYGKKADKAEKAYAETLTNKIMDNELEDHLANLSIFENVGLQIKKFLGNDSRTLVAMLIVDLYDSIITEWSRILGIKLTTTLSYDLKEKYRNSWKLLPEIRQKSIEFVEDSETLKFASMMNNLEAILDRNQSNFRNIMTHQALSRPPIDDGDLSILVQNLDLLIHFYGKFLNEVKMKQNLGEKRENK